ncbi:MAG: DUF3427 domain-containing protein [Acidobacteria bacterium]|nr:MAG: DUF3427 domain-containing protein [Acidobacteriota bacterium]REK09291.1 MAG: DUF3427 domain-containing protein [Acidobacteriota bacterium]
MKELQPGLYDTLVDELLRGQLDDLTAQRLKAALQDVDAAELPDRVADVVAAWVRRAVASASEKKREGAALAISSAVLDAIHALEPAAASRQQRLGEPIQRLAAVEPLAPTNEPIPIRRPLTPLRDTVLLTNARDQPAVGREIAAEIDSADRIDLVLAFIRWTGIRELLPELRRHVERGRRLRIITTTYTGSTEARALQALADLGAELRVSYDHSSTRLHAKAWLFQRRSGFSTVYVGSSNLTFSAQVTGLEWNVRASQRLNPELVAAFERTFETYWEDPHFEPFDAEKFARATSKLSQGDVLLTPFDIEPYPFQRQILERLEVERRRGRPHSLVVAATGTGKTVVAALDYRALRRQLDRARLLFVAHRVEILEQSRTMFRHVLRDGAFGELWTRGERPERWEHVFASIQSLTVNDATSIEPERFDVVIVDEFHHAAAESYVALLDHLRPRHLLGLTATPERADGLDILRWFGDRIAVELRLWDALEQGLLSPFHYFGLHDGTDLSEVTWKRGAYDVAELTNVYTANDLWVAKVLQAVHDKIGDPQAMRALGFCVSIDHATFMAARFERAGLAARAITSRTALAEREQALRDLEKGVVQVLFTVDLFNEGVDVPAIDVVLMLRPTESATVFLQQLGRGLRRTRDKDVLTVLDFVGHQSRHFRFDLRYRRMLGRTRKELEADVRDGFPFLPAGCLLELDAVARDIVLDNLRNALPTRWPQRIQELRELGDVGLGEFLRETGLELEDLYRGGRTWTELRRAVGFLPEAGATEQEKAIGRGVARLLHLDDQERIDGYRLLLERSEPPETGQLDERAARRLEGLLLTVMNPKKGDYASLAEAAADLWRHHALRGEILELLPLLEEQVVHLHTPLELLHPVPLQVHAHYTREEILAAFGASTVSTPVPLQTGVYWHEPSRTDLLFITLQKTEKDYSPTTRYLDYAISDQLFHWESQAITAADSERGRNYIEHAKRNRNVALFVRPTKKDATGRTVPYFCVGTATYVRHESERPMQITWQLRHRLPGDVFAAYRAAVA